MPDPLFVVALLVLLAVLWLLAIRPALVERHRGRRARRVEVAHRVTIRLPITAARPGDEPWGLRPLLAEVELADRLRLTIPETDLVVIRCTVVARGPVEAQAEAMRALGQLGLVDDGVHAVREVR